MLYESMSRSKITSVIGRLSIYQAPVEKRQRLIITSDAEQIGNLFVQLSSSTMTTRDLHKSLSFGLNPV